MRSTRRSPTRWMRPRRSPRAMTLPLRFAVWWPLAMKRAALRLFDELVPADGLEDRNMAALYKGTIPLGARAWRRWKGRQVPVRRRLEHCVAGNRARARSGAEVGMTNPQQYSGAAIAHDWWQRLTTKDGARSGLPPRGSGADAARRHVDRGIARARSPAPRPHDSRTTRSGLRSWPASSRSCASRTTLAWPALLARTKLDDDQSALLSEGRFRRLLQTQPDELMVAMRRLVRMTKGRANVREPVFRHSLLGRQGQAALDIRLLRRRDVLGAGGAPVSTASEQLER